MVQGLIVRLKRLFANPSNLTDQDLEARRSLLRDLLRQKREMWQSGATDRGGSIAERRNRSRFARRKTQELLRQIRKRPGVLVNKPLLAAPFRSSPLLDGLLQNRRELWRSARTRMRPKVMTEIKLDVFSFLDDPEMTMRALKRIAQSECEDLEALINFPDGFCTDIAPYLVLSELWPTMAPVFRGGHMSVPTQKVIEAVGLRKALDMRLRGVTDLRDIWAFPLQRRRPADTSTSVDRYLEPQSREKVADRFCDAVDVWLGRPEIRRELTPEGRAWITSIIGELLDNAERHARPVTKDGDWSTAAFLARRNEGSETVYRCYMAFLSVGETIGESLRTCAPRVGRELDRYCNMHETLAKRGQSRDTLRTLFALQDGVTRDDDDRGGVGFQEVMQFVNELGGTPKQGHEPRITIVSGSSCITLKPPYILGQRRDDPSDPRVIWFNPENSPTVPPDRAHVFDLSERFGGTIISVAFTLDPDYLNAKVA